MEYWVSRLIYSESSFKDIIPIFHHSSIPTFEVL
jgi:hypothetical protein